MAPDEPSDLGNAVQEVSDKVRLLVSEEIALAKAELRGDVKNAALGGGLFGAAGYLGLLASILLVIAAAYGLVAAGLSPWLAFLIVAVVLLVLAGILALVGKSRLGKLGPPERTIRNAQATIAAVKPGSHQQ